MSKNFSDFLKQHKGKTLMK